MPRPNLRLAQRAARCGGGGNAVAVTGTIGGQLVRDALVWHRPPSRTLFAIPAGVLSTSGTAAQPIGSDAFFEGGQAHDIANPANLFARDYKPSIPTGDPGPICTRAGAPVVSAIGCPFPMADTA